MQVICNIQNARHSTNWGWQHYKTSPTMRFTHILYMANNSLKIFWMCCCDKSCSNSYRMISNILYKVVFRCSSGLKFVISVGLWSRFLTWYLRFYRSFTTCHLPSQICNLGLCNLMVGDFLMSLVNGNGTLLCFMFIWRILTQGIKQLKLWYLKYN